MKINKDDINKNITVIFTYYITVIRTSFDTKTS